MSSLLLFLVLVIPDKFYCCGVWVHEWWNYISKRETNTSEHLWYQSARNHSGGSLHRPDRSWVASFAYDYWNWARADSSDLLVIPIRVNTWCFWETPWNFGLGLRHIHWSPNKLLLDSKPVDPRRANSSCYACRSCKMQEIPRCCWAFWGDVFVFLPPDIFTKLRHGQLTWSV